MYEPQLWREDAFVQRFYEAYKLRATAGPVHVKTLNAARNVRVPEAAASAAM